MTFLRNLVRHAATLDVELALIVHSPAIDRILDGTKTWELRERATKIRGPIALVRGDNGLVEGVAELIDCIGSLPEHELLATQSRHRLSPNAILAGAAGPAPYAWVLAKARRLAVPVPYAHPRGAVLWVSLCRKDRATLNRALAA